MEAANRSQSSIGMEPVEPRQTLADLIVTRLRAAILAGNLVPGIQYSAGGLAEQFGVSRTPVREALLALERVGMVRIEKNRGVRIIPTALQEVVECFQLRLLLEAPAAAHAAELVDQPGFQVLQERFEAMQHAADRNDSEATLRADRDFHTAILALAGNSKLVSVLEDLRNLVLIRGIATAPNARSLQELVDDHQDILEAIGANDATAAGEAMRRHILNTATLLIHRETRENSTDAADLEAKLRSFRY
ncbi:GntR family transcriptional regulator [Rhodococcus erythropolis]|uniref:GntR family transcriptional regulator n=1 Tax=Rhodococcus erythropolis TaxID=1833 RepID=UPI001BE81019|nr:GntR family transcriptional regulator [Rhodococcus erythropolis]MBT2266069.1 GntR family transcriptional regulator [Rhodococcus erythropolis]